MTREPLVTPPSAAASAGTPPVQRFDEDEVLSILPQLMDSLSDAVVVVDREQRLVAANAQYIASFGMRRSDLIGSRCTDTVHCPEDRTSGEGGRCAAC